MSSIGSNLPGLPETIPALLPELRFENVIERSGQSRQMVLGLIFGLYCIPFYPLYNLSFCIEDYIILPLHRKLTL